MFLDPDDDFYSKSKRRANKHKSLDFGAVFPSDIKISEELIHCCNNHKKIRPFSTVNLQEKSEVTLRYPEGNSGS